MSERLELMSIRELKRSRIRRRAAMMGTKRRVRVAHTMGVRGEYKFTRLKAITNDFGERVPGPVVEESPWGRNKMTTRYFNLAFVTANLQANSCVVGSGNTPPAEGDTALVSFIAGTNSKISQTHTVQAGTSPRYAQAVVVFEFGEGVAAGNVAEAAVSEVTSVPTGATAIISRGLVVDGSEAPTVVTVQSDEFLRVTWRFRMFVPEDATGTVSLTIDGTPTNFDYTVRATNMQGSNTSWTRASIGVDGSYFVSDGGFNATICSGVSTQSTLVAYDNDMGADFPTNQRATAVSKAAYVANSKQRSITLTWSLAYGNVSFRSIFITPSTTNSEGKGYFQVLLSAAVTKVSTKVFTFQFTLALANV
jgi:hypothetical protein